jgi:AraC-like DNA-binding protein
MKEQIFVKKIGVEEAEKIARSANEPHMHDFEELLVGMEGRLEHFIDFKETTFCSPYISFVTRGKLHRVRPTIFEGKCSLWQIRFASDFLPETTFRLYSYYHDHANIEIKDGACFKRMVALCEMMGDEMERPEPQFALLHDLLKTLFTMIEGEHKKLVPGGEAVPKTQSTTFKNFLKILEENFRRAEGVDFYAEKLFMSTRNLNLICQSILHKSVSEIIETRKLIEAKNLLIYSDKTISDIGFELGFNEKAYFTNVFKKRTGSTPTEFREEMHKLIS